MPQIDGDWHGPKRGHDRIRMIAEARELSKQFPSSRDKVLQVITAIEQAVKSKRWQDVNALSWNLFNGLQKMKQLNLKPGKTRVSPPIRKKLSRATSARAARTKQNAASALPVKTQVSSTTSLSSRLATANKLKAPTALIFFGAVGFLVWVAFK